VFLRGAALNGRPSKDLKASTNLDSAVAIAPARGHVPPLPSGAYKFAWPIVAAIMLAYICVFTWLSPLLLQDNPNHLARAVVIADLAFHGGRQFGGVFGYQLLAVPYILGDLVLVMGVVLFGTKYGAALWTVLVLLSLPCALLFYMRVVKVARDGQILVCMLSLYLGTNWFFYMGFLAFELAVAAIIACLALIELLRQRWSTALFVLYIIALALAYLIHLTTLIFLTAAVGVSSAIRLWQRTTTVRTETSILLPIAALLAWHFGVVGRYLAPSDQSMGSYYWGSVLGKIIRVGGQFSRYSPLMDRFLLVAFIVCIALAVRRDLSRQALTQPRVLEMLVLAATFVAMYVVLPVGYAHTWALDVRALPLINFFLIIACLQLGSEAPASRGPDVSLALPLATLLVVANLAYLTVHLYKANVWLSQYRTVVAAVPPGAYVLPIYTRPAENSPAFHAGSFVVVDRGAAMPYLFSFDTGYYHMKYFRYLDRRYAPDEKWYIHSADVDWPSVACDYDFLLAMKPFDPRRIDIATRPVFENESAALLAVSPHPCPRRAAASVHSSLQ
jgi:hypothetical protein